MTISFVDGQNGSLSFYTREAEGARAAKSVEILRPGFSSVAQMLATPGFTWAHRGSGNGGMWPEMSLLAYTHAVRLGYGVLEVSLNRTKDGVWFGLHDTHLDRMALGVSTQTLDPINMTWAQVNAYQATQAGRQGGPQPFMRLDDIVAAYGNTHILLLDPKYRRNDRLSEFLDICVALGPNRVIIKADLDFPQAIIQAKARDPRFKGWGYFWGANGTHNNANFNTWVAAWDMVGCEWNDSQAIFNQIKALGKPIVAHIVENQSQYDTAITKGALGVQCGATHLIKSVGP